MAPGLARLNGGWLIGTVSCDEETSTRVVGLSLRSAFGGNNEARGAPSRDAHGRGQQYVTARQTTCLAVSVVVIQTTLRIPCNFVDSKQAHFVLPVVPLQLHQMHVTWYGDSKEGMAAMHTRSDCFARCTALGARLSPSLVESADRPFDTLRSGFVFSDASAPPASPASAGCGSGSGRRTSEAGRAGRPEGEGSAHTSVGDRRILAGAGSPERGSRGGLAVQHQGFAGRKRSQGRWAVA